MLFDGEKLNGNIELAHQPKKSDADISEKYIRGDIRIVTEQAKYFLDSISKLKDVKLDTGPTYQRRDRWDIQKQSRLIESFIMNIPVPPIFLYEYRLAHFEVMDGKQRITAIREFYENRFKLEGLEYWPELEGKYYKDLPQTIRDGIDRRSLSAITLLYETAQNDPERSKKLKQLVFERINSGGVELSDQESRNAILDGPMNTLCKKLSENLIFREMWQISPGNLEDGEEPTENYRKMTDVELVLRFFAIRQRQAFINEHKYLKDYLDFYLKSANLFPENLLNNFEALFNDTIKLIYEVLGEKAFCAFRKSNGNIHSLTSRPSYLMYEPICYVFSKYISQTQNIIDNKISINKAINTAITSNIDKFKGRLSNPSYIFERISILDTAIISELEK